MWVLRKMHLAYFREQHTVRAVPEQPIVAGICVSRAE